MARTQAADYDKKRAAITDAAAKLFGENGFAAASISELAANCEMSKSLIYHYYQSKDDILFDVMNDHIDSLLDVVAAHPADSGPPETVLRALTRDLLARYEGSAAAQSVLLNELETLPKSKSDEIKTKQRKIIAHVRNILRAAAPGAVDAQLRAKVMLYFGMLNWTHNWFDPTDGLSRDELADLAADTILGTD